MLSTFIVNPMYDTGVRVAAGIAQTLENKKYRVNGCEYLWQPVY
jgi:hypothetical protein